MATSYRLHGFRFFLAQHFRKNSPKTDHQPSALRKISCRNQQGFTYLMVMFFVVIVGISLMVIGQQWSVTVKRDKEAELFFRGTRIKEAIERYAADFQVQKSTRPNQYPLNLKDLTQKPKRYLQTVYKDPITGEDFELIKTGTQIRGVRSKSQDTPFDKINFKGASSYHAVRFEAQAQRSTNCAPDISDIGNKFGCDPQKKSPTDTAPETNPESPTNTQSISPEKTEPF